jgi:hypothetical protein
MDRRATLECQAICLYLERYSTDGKILELLEFPRTRCGLGALLSDTSEGSPETGIIGWQLECFNAIESH